MNLEQFHYIIEVAKTHSLSKAASNLFVTQSAVSQSIANLESELGVRIFTRTRLGAVPTKEGMDIIQKAIEVVNKLQEIKDGAMRLSEVMHAELRVASIPGAMSALVKTVASFKNDYPNVSFRIIEGMSDEILDEIKHNKVDIGLIGIRDDTSIVGTGMLFEPIWESNIVIGVWKNSPLAIRNKVTPEDMRHQSFALYDEPFIHEFERGFSEAHGQLPIFFTSNNPNAIATAMKENLAATLGYDFSFFDSPHTLNGDIVTREIDGVRQLPIHLGWVRSERNKSAQISNLFIQRFLNHFQIRSI
ncbi:LysR family transcriptional regulator [Paenibacillus sp. GSMTC-2017]|uniref:LysR substrate-binding domain-containing protein n=1 Tax=Paenibacillus sp. GSMTC-2017 TaxID=2794350 RepID=UPI0018D5AAC0|nr:LysR family transcriptional regulator [Paenibacillus sp. GSMTC-2017]MBH5319578.1 LysR family transcriptional regulator [Paenibacillus sp. GSMTC-2017]